MNSAKSSNLKTVRLVTHCYAGHYDHYAKALWYQLCSIADCENVTVTVWYCDVIVGGLLEEARETFGDDKIIELYAPPERLFRRAIGRNKSALMASTDFVWFTDCDYTFTPETFDALRRINPTEPVFPLHTYISRSHAAGQEDLDRVDLMDLERVTIDRSRFIGKRYDRAIGGVQIVPRSVCNDHGYLAGSRWVKTIDPSTGFRSCICDRVYRLSLKRNGHPFQPIELPGVYRLRHAAKGRDCATVNLPSGS